MKGAPGGPRIVNTPGPDGIASPTRTNGWPLIFTWLGDSGPMGNGYGTPESELTIRQVEPHMASGIPLAVGPPGGIIVIVPVSGGPAAPGASETEHPIVTGGPGIAFLFSPEWPEIASRFTSPIRANQRYEVSANHKPIRRPSLVPLLS